MSANDTAESPDYKESVISGLAVPPRGRWSDALDTIAELAGRSAYAFRPPLTQDEIWSLRSGARWRGMVLYVRQHPARKAVETRVWWKGKVQEVRP